MKKLLLVIATILAGNAPVAAKSKSSGTPRSVKTFHLYVNDGEWEFADGESTYIVGYVAYNDKFEEAPKGAKLPAPTIPSPELRVKLGDEVHVILHNAGH